MQGLNFIAIDFETANSSRASICEAGICVVRDGSVQETRSWLVRPQGNVYNYWNTKIHGIRPEDTDNSPGFPEVWIEISKYFNPNRSLGSPGRLPRRSPLRLRLGEKHAA